MDPGKYRHEGVALCINHLKTIARDLPLCFGGDLNLFKDADGVPAYKLLKSQFTDWRVPKNHYGHTGTFAGFSSDKFKACIDAEGPEKGVLKGTAVDFIGYHKIKPTSSFALVSEFNPETQEIYSSYQPIIDSVKRALGSDHALIGNIVEF